MGTTTTASRSTLYTRSPGASSAMARSPLGVAMGVSSEAQSQRGHPLLQVWVVGSGGWHLGPTAIGPGTSQQISPGWQHAVAQHRPAGPQRDGLLHGGAPHFPWSQ